MGNKILPDWLFKEEPDHYSFADLERDGSTVWDGIDNNLARKHLREVKKGDRIWYYHTGKEKAVVGLMTAISNAMPDANNSDPKAVLVKVKTLRRLAAPVPLKRIKEDQLLSSWDLVRLPRLSIMPVSTAQARRLEEMSQETP
jgi:predicted RNA-binding protein with PUA-like domain